MSFSTSGPAVLTDGAIDLVTRISPTVGPQFSISGTCGSMAAGCVNVTSGAYLPGLSNPAAGTYVYAPGSVEITGTTAVGSGTLYSSPFLSNITVQVNSDGPGTLQGTLAPGSLLASLASALFISPDTTTGSGNDLFINFVANENGGGGSGFMTQNQYQVLAAEVPEPASMMLLGTGLLGLYTSARRRLGKPE